MDKTKLKDIILKTLEKEGGAAGLKALAKAAKTSKGKLKKDLDKIGGVKQHKHGDYISTPISEIGPGSGEKAPKGCKKCFDRGKCCRTFSEMQGTITGIECFDCNSHHSTSKMSLTPINEAETYVGSSSGASIFCSKCPCGCSDVIQNYQPAGGGDATYAVCKDPCPENTTGTSSTSNIALGGKTADNKFINRPRKPMRLREIKEIIETMLDEKKKKKKDRCHRKADQVYGTKTSAYKSGAIVKCRQGKIWKVGSKKKKQGKK